MSDSALPCVEPRTYLIKRNCSIAQAVPSYAPARAALWINKGAAGPYVFAAGAAVLVYMLFGWFGAVVHESPGGRYGAGVDRSFRWGMAWFIFSEVMFLAAFFGTLFYVRAPGLPDLSSAEHQALLWKGFEAQWPERVAPATVDPYTPMQAWGIPTLNTALLLSSAVTVTWAHWGCSRGSAPGSSSACS